MSFVRRLFQSHAPGLAALRRLIRKLELGGYAFRADVGAVDRPPYAHIVLNAARLAQKLGIPRISVIEFGVAGGNGLVSLERHAEAVEELLGVKVEIYGFDTGKGLPAPTDYRDLPYHWKAGFFEMDEPALRSRLKRSTLVLGNVEETAANFFKEHRPAPIGAIVYDFDFYSSTAVALQMLKAGDAFYLPRVFCYFDDVMGDEAELYNDYTGERLAIHEFNAGSETIKLGIPYYLRGRRAQTWHEQIWIGHFFQHPRYNDFISGDGQQLRLESP